MGVVCDYFAKRKAIKEIGKDKYDKTVLDILDNFTFMYFSSDEDCTYDVDSYFRQLADKKHYSTFAKFFAGLSAFGIGNMVVNMLQNDPDMDSVVKYILLLPTTMILSIIVDGVSSGKLREDREYLSRYLKNHINDADLTSLQTQVGRNNCLKNLERECKSDGRVNDIEMSDATLDSCYKSAVKELTR